MTNPIVSVSNSRTSGEAVGGRDDVSLPRLPRWLAHLALLLASVGLLLVVIGYLTPAYTDPVAAERVRFGLECTQGVPNPREDQQCASDEWHRSMNALRTYKWDFVDAGAGLLLSGLTVGAFFWWNRKRSWRQLSTPRWRVSILALAALSWLLQIPAYDSLFLTELTRGYYPHWADTIAIPMLAFERVLLALFLPYMAIWLCFVVGTKLPVPVFSTVPSRPLVNAFWTGATLLLLVPIVLALIGAILEGPTLMIPFLWLTLWLALCARAAALTRHRRLA